MKKRIALWLLPLCLLFLTAGFAQPPQNPAKEADIRRLIDMTGGAELGVQMGRTLLEQLRPMLGDRLPPGERSQRILDTLSDKILLRFTSKKLTELVIPIYDKHMTRQEILGLIKFYQTPLGKKVLKTLPAILQESQAVGSQWGEKIFRDVVREMEAEFPELRELTGQ